MTAKNVGLRFLMSCFIFLAVGPRAGAMEDAAYLDRPYTEPAGFKRFKFQVKRDILPPFSDVDGLIAKQTPVKAQMERQTCSIFSSTALLESLLHAEFGLKIEGLDLSEQWLEYLAERKTSGQGSNTRINYLNITSYGMISETSEPYMTSEWTSVNDSATAFVRCGHLVGARRMICLKTGRDPELYSMLDEVLRVLDLNFYKMKLEGLIFREAYLASFQVNDIRELPSLDDVKRLLARGVPVAMDLDFYYGAWNHKTAETLNMKRNIDHWRRGLVGYPAAGSVDLQASRSQPSGHSVLLVGYDDRYQISVPTEMRDGTIKPITYQGVFYFKNSWGTEGFGSEAMINGKNRPGYGTIVQQYAEEYGRFYQFPLRKKSVD